MKDDIFVYKMTESPKYRRSVYYDEKLKPLEKRRYEQKLAEIKILDDPFSLKNDEFDRTNSTPLWSQINYPDIFSYLIQFPAQYTAGSLKAYKSDEGYKYVVSGLVYNVRVKTIPDGNFLVDDRVRHGQSQFTVTPLHGLQ